MKLLFLAFIALLAVVGNFAIFESFSVGRAIGGTAFNLFVLSLLVIWWSSYVSGTQARARLFVIGHAFLTLAAGIGLTLVGASVALSNSCDTLTFGHKPHALLGQLATYLQSHGYCREFGFGIVLLGLSIAYPSARLCVGIARRSSGLP